MDAGLSVNPFDQAVRQQLIEEQAKIRKLASRDREVRAHEQAHAAVGGAHAGHPHYQYESGPNGVRYATSGHVKIDVSAVPNDPAATLQKMQTVARAALAPAEPSPADRKVAAEANQKAASARAELAKQSSERMDEVNEADAQRSPIASSRNGLPAIGSTAGSLIDIIA